MQRVLDIDLDFFVYEVVYWPDPTVRADADEHPVWEIDDAIAFLRERCGLNRRLPGFLTENHGELFALWRSAIADGLLVPPFHVTHVDAHADLGLGDAGYVYLLTELLLLAPNDRQHPLTGMTGLNDGNHLAFAIACRWIAELVYVYGEGGGSDELSFVMQGHDRRADHVQLAAMSQQELDVLRHRHEPPTKAELEPAVPYRSTRWQEFWTDGPFDYVCLTRSPPYTPVTADPLFERLRSTFIDHLALSG
jgi:hypothetical protein